MQKLDKIKGLEEKIERIGKSVSAQDEPSAHSRSAHDTRLVQKRPTKKPKGAFSAKSPKARGRLKIKLP